MTILRKSLLGSICLTSVLAVSSTSLNLESKSQVIQAPANELPGALSVQVPGEVLTEVELYFGLSKSGGSVVSENEWRNFLDREVTPRFMDGLTVLSGYGQYRTKSGKLSRENTKVVILIYQNSPQKEKDLQTIINIYKQTFRQESVLRITSQVKAAF